MEEQTLIRQAIDGDDQAYGHLVERYQRGLVRYCYTLVGDADQAEDVAQEAFIKAYQHLGDYHTGSRFSTWLYRIAHNTAMSQLRSKPVLPLSEDFEVPYEDNTAEALERGDREEALRRAVSRLPENFRAVVHLHYWEKRSYEEIAEVLKVPATTVKTWLFRARQQLKEECNGIFG